MSGNMLAAIGKAIDNTTRARKGVPPDRWELAERFVPMLVEDLLHLSCHGTVREQLGEPQTRTLIENLVRTGGCRVHAVPVVVSKG